MKSLRWLFVIGLTTGIVCLRSAATADVEGASSVTIPRGTIVPILVTKDIRVGG